MRGPHASLQWHRRYQNLLGYLDEQPNVCRISRIARSVRWRPNAQPRPRQDVEETSLEMARSMRTPSLILHQTQVMFKSEAWEMKSAVGDALPDISAILVISNHEVLYRQELRQDGVEVRMRGIIVQISSQMVSRHLLWGWCQGQSGIVNEVAEETQARREQDAQLQSL